jgi:hypothetical protein
MQSFNSVAVATELTLVLLAVGFPFSDIGSRISAGGRDFLDATRR